MGKHVIYTQSGTFSYNQLKQGYQRHLLQPSDPYPVVVTDPFDNLSNLESVFPEKPLSAHTHKHLHMVLEGSRTR